jgi:hypothetical protein
MTTFDTNARNDLNGRGRRITGTRKEAEAHIWRLFDGLPALFARRAADPAEALAKAERREAARRAADNLLLR